MTLKKITVNGVVWSGIEKFSTLIVHFITTLIIARFIAPEDFGLIGMITIFIVVAQVIMDSGFGQALIRKTIVTDLEYSSVFYLNISLGIIAYIILFLISGEIANFYNVPTLEKISKISFLVIPINSIGLIQYTILNKNIDFKKLSKITISSAFLSAIIGIGIAYLYKNVWALVFQNLFFYFFRTLFLWLSSKWKPILKFSKNSIRSMYSFSIKLLLTGLVSSLFDNLYSVVIGKVYDAKQLGFYSQADRFQKIPSLSITDVIQRVTFPALTKIQDNNERLKVAYIKIIGIALYLVVPIMFFLASVSDELFELLLPPEWKVAALYFKILCFAGTLYPLHSININLLKVKGEGSTILYLEIFRKFVLVLILFISSYYSIIYVIFGQLVYSIIVLFFNLYFCGRIIKLSVFNQLKEIAPIFIISFIMFCLIYLCNNLLVDLTPLIRVFICFFTSIIVYLSLSIFFKLKSLNELKEIIINLR